MTGDNLTSKQEAFCLAFAENGGNATQAYLDTYHPKNENTAAACASKLLRNPKILSRIRQLQDEAAQARLMSVLQIKGTLSDIVRNESEKTSDRIAASNLLLRAAGEFVRAKVDDDGVTLYSGSGEGDTVIILPPIRPIEECELDGEDPDILDSMEVDTL